jgi:hypothetical protein
MATLPLAGLYADIGGPGSVEAARMATTPGRELTLVL